jgi:hypothetical protein
MLTTVSFDKPVVQDFTFNEHRVRLERKTSDIMTLQYISDSNQWPEEFEVVDGSGNQAMMLDHHYLLVVLNSYTLKMFGQVMMQFNSNLLFDIVVDPSVKLV